MATIKTKDIEVEVASKGAELRSIKGLKGIEYLWQGDPAFWSRRSPLLFPIVGALPGGSFTHKGKSYSMGNHGFVRDLEFKTTSQSPDLLRYELSSDAASLAIYPFRFKLAVTYKVRGSALEVGYEVANEGDERLPFSIGGHSGFRAPLLPDEKREDYELVFEKPETVDRYFLNSDNLRSGESENFLRGSSTVPLTPALFERGAIVLKDHVSRKVTLKSRVSGRFVEVSFPDFPQLGIWAPKDGAAGPTPFVCIEPWFGVMALADSTQEFERKEAILSIGRGELFRSTYTIRVG
jgi:galactose mutarotase-like enzyme